MLCAAAELAWRGITARVLSVLCGAWRADLARRLGLDGEVVEAARRRLDTSVAQSDEAITQLEALRGQLQDEEVAT